MSDRSHIATALIAIVGRRHVLSAPGETERYRSGYRCGHGECLAVVRPGTLVEMWRVLQACVGADAIVIIQAANTGLTGGSTPDGAYDRPVIIINTLRLAGIRVLRNGDQVVCLAGSTLGELERALKPIGREPHSVIGSSCIGASVVGGVCNNSGGALVRRGPAYTELSLHARVGASGALELVNHLGIELGDEPEHMLARLDSGVPLTERLVPTQGCASDSEYSRHVRDVDAATPARFNADPRRLFEASGCAGKLAVFAVRLDTFPMESETATFYVGTNEPNALARLRRRLLSTPGDLPIAAEYLHRTAFDVAARYGKDMFLALTLFGTERVDLAFRASSALSRFARRARVLPDALGDWVSHFLARLWPAHLPRRIRAYRDTFEHHLILKVGARSRAETLTILADVLGAEYGSFFECTPEEDRRAFRHRFVAAGAAIRYRALHAGSVQDIVALDVALRRNDDDWPERLPHELASQLRHVLYYGHFLCHVFHQDYILRKGVDPGAFEEAVCRLLDGRGAEYPAEHNVGHLYDAKPALRAHYRDLDPRNLFNPGIGGSPKGAFWTETAPEGSRKATEFTHETA